MKFLYSVACAALLLSSFNAAAREGVTPRIGNQQQQFVQNNGQIKDQYGVLNSTVDARVTGNGLSMFVGDAMLHYQWQQKVDSVTSEIYRMDVELVGADKTVKPIFEEPTGYYETYYISSYTQEPIRAEGYNRIVYKQVYKNIDWVLYTGAEGNGVVKYDFIVHPGGNVADIRLKYSGVSNIKLDNGELIAETPYGSVTEQAPYCYEQKSGKTVQSKYKLTTNKHEGTGILSFDVSDFDGTLVVDPKLLWATFFGGLGEGGGIVGARDGFAYACGVTQTPNMATTGVHKVQVSGGGGDCYLVKFDDSCRLQWATYYGGAGYEWADDIAADRNGGIYMVGTTNSDTGIATQGAFKTSYTPQPLSSAGFLAKFKTNGTLEWATYYGDGAYIDAVACDRDNNVYVAGATGSSSGIATPNTFMPNLTVSGGGFVAKFTPSGQRVWGTYVYDTLRKGVVNTIDIDKNNDVVIGGVVGNVSSSVPSFLGTSGVFQQYPIAGNNSPFVAKLNGLNGTRIWATFYCAGVSSETRAVACDDSNQVYAFINFIPTCVSNAANPNPGGLH